MEAGKEAPATAKLKIAGTWTGVLEVQLESWTLPMLREDVARRSGGSPDCINLICSGKILKDDGSSQSLQQLGLRNNSKVLASATSPDSVKALKDEEAAQADRSSKLSRIRAAAHALAQRHADGSFPVEDFNLQLENQSGQKVNFGSENDQRAVMMGLMLHEKAKSLIKKQKFKDALDVLSIAEEAFSLCDPKIIEMIDNVPILQLDTVWCYFLLRDISCLSMAGTRLAKSREGFQRSHGRDNSRFRLLQAGRPAELALYVRLELLEGVVAFYSGNHVEAYKSLSAAKSKFDQLQVLDEALSLLMSMGYKQREAKRALRMSGQDIQRAVDFLVEERAKKACRHQEDIQRKNEIIEQKRYGMTANNKPVSIQRLNELASMGFERYLAAEALRVNNNDSEKALDLLTNPDKNYDLQQKIDSRKRTRQQRQASARAPTQIAHSGDIAATASTTLELESGSHEFDSEDMAASSKEVRDEEMEDELAKELTGDAYADYDLEVSKEGEAIAEYLALLESSTSMKTGSS
ncbi:NEDD8 ultimate buster 1 isoform X2 [Phalaenopsis equestris]|uniref:NEDD8 ultimate buster 1 isoform X2 n=1 Tax=Phalaenopsis equestris TaxID=78828 RepID=UPI0009E1C7E2|nr:NEDD8 ultimate buster 1 isoform X2 [Phalaenopsis equestris]